jgi:hypothetical protein
LPISLENATPRPLFVPLKTEWFRAFASGSKREEFRVFGPRWNERTCAVGRRVTLSHGYSRRERLHGQVARFERRAWDSFSAAQQARLCEVFGRSDVDVAVIGVRLDADQS